VTLPQLAERTFTAGEIQTIEVLTTTQEFTTSLVSYTSDGLQITGLLNMPRGDGTFPAVVMVHGYVSPEQYTRGLDAQAPAEELTRHGYITLVPDLRGYAESEHGMNLFLSGWIADVINAGSALKQFPRADAENIGLWGHSMGGGIATRAMVVSDVFDAVVLYAPISADVDDMFMDPFGGETTGVTEQLVKALLLALDDPQYRAAVSPRNYLDRTAAPVSIHVGTADTVTPKEWARAIRDGLVRAGKTVEYFDYLGEGHALRGEARTEFLARVLDFFDRNLK
jgi:dipeptidyl aminopeptidase/acylaminoacyl peptidase